MEYNKPTSVEPGKEPATYSVGGSRIMLRESSPNKSLPECGKQVKKTEGKLLLEKENDNETR